MIRVQGETLDNLAEGVAVFGSDGRLRLHNAAFARMWQLSPQALADRPHIERSPRCASRCMAMLPPGRRCATSSPRSTAAKRSGPIERRDGSVVDCTTVPLPDGATLVTFHDVTDSVNVERALRERNEALEDADKIKIDFVHHVSYELRSPLTNIIGFVHLLGDPTTGPLADKQREYLDYITVSTNTLLALINNILDLATIDAGRMQLNLGPVDIRETMAAAAEGVQDRLVSAGLVLDISAPADIGSFIADKLRVRQILFNLLANAASFSPAGATVTLQAERRVDAWCSRSPTAGRGFRPMCWKRCSTGSSRIRSARSTAAPGIGLVAGPLLRRAARRHGHHRLRGRTRHHRDMYIPAR